MAECEHETKTDRCGTDNDDDDDDDENNDRTQVTTTTVKRGGGETDEGRQMIGDRSGRPGIGV